MQNRCDHQILIVSRHLGDSVFPHMIVKCDVWTARYIVPGYKPKARLIKRHIVVIQSTLIPFCIIGIAGDHLFVDAHRTVHIFDDVFHRQVTQSCFPVNFWVFRSHVIEFLKSQQVFLLNSNRQPWRHRIVLSAVKPGSEKHLIGSATEEIALLEKLTDSSHTCAKSLRN